jgi:hypothetical protein
MKISQETIAVLKNFSTINSNLLVKPGSTISTISPTKNILAEASVSETFDVEFGIWDLSKFLATISLFKDPEFEFSEDHVEISSEGSRASIRYYYSEPELLVKADKKLKMPPTAVNFTLTSKDYGELQKAASVLQAPDLALESTEEGRMILRVFDRKDSTSHSYSIDVGENKSGASFSFLFKTENLKMIPGTYEVGISDKKVSQFRTANGITYWISLEADSVFEGSNGKVANVASR